MTQCLLCIAQILTHSSIRQMRNLDSLGECGTSTSSGNSPRLRGMVSPDNSSSSDKQLGEQAELDELLSNGGCNKTCVLFLVLPAFVLLASLAEPDELLSNVGRNKTCVLFQVLSVFVLLASFTFSFLSIVSSSNKEHKI